MASIQHIVLLHGWGCDGRIWQHTLPFFNAYADTIIIDIPYMNDGAIYSVDELCETIANQIPENSVLCGWSLGGMLATQIAARYPSKIKALITLASNIIFVESDAWPSAMPVNTFDDFFSLFEKKPKQALKRFGLLQVHGDAQAKQQLPFLQSFSAEVDDENLKSGLVLLKTINNVDVMNNIRCPALYCFGENDTLVPVSAAKMVGAVCHEQQQVVVFPESGHLLHQPNNKLNEHLTPFLSELCRCNG